MLLYAFPKNVPKEVQVFRSDCEKLVERYNTLLKQISEYMKDHSKPSQEDPENSAITLSYHDTDSFFLISIKEDLEILTNDCEKLLEKASFRTKKYSEGASIGLAGKKENWMGFFCEKII